MQRNGVPLPLPSDCREWWESYVEVVEDDARPVDVAVLILRAMTMGTHLEMKLPAEPRRHSRALARGWWIVLLALALAGLAVAAGKTWARWFAIAAVFVNVIAQIGFLPAYPLWSAIMIGLDVVVIFALTARWDEARAAM